jgi:hypothetical protein
LEPPSPHYRRERTFAGLRVAICLLVLLTSACSGAVKRDLRFQAPPGWFHASGLNDADNWFDPKSKDFIVARQMSDPRPATPAIGEQRTQMQICGFHAAYYGTGSLTTGQEAEYVDTDWYGKRYMAIYIRPAGSPPNPAAEAALRTLCK